MRITIKNPVGTWMRRLGRLLIAVSLVGLGLTVTDARSVNRMLPVTTDEVAAGELLWKSDRGLLPLPIAGLEVDLQVTGVMVHGRVTQRFDNPADEVIEAIYVFPLPGDAAVHSMEIRVGDRRIVSVVKEKEEARKTYERARDEGRKTALVTQRRPNLFTTEVANINPGESVAVVLEYYEEVRYDDGRFSLRFPLTYTPRFNSEFADAPFVDAGGAGEAGAGDLPEARLRVTLRPGFDLDEVACRSHRIETREIPGGREIATAPGKTAADRDFLLSWRPRLGEEPQAAVFVEDRNDGRYALIMLVPPAPESAAGLGLPTETLFIVDVSGSMRGPSIQQARRALSASLSRLRPEDRFNILRFNDQNSAFRGGFQQASADAIAEALEWVDGLNAGGGTMIYPALMRGLAMMGESHSSHVQRIVFLTDGAVGNEQELLRAVVERLGETRLHTIGIGSAPNAWLMRKMAELGRGLCGFIANTQEAENRVADFFERLDRPVMTDIELETEGIELDSTRPRRLGDLHAGEPLLLSARLASVENDGELRLGGQTREGWVQASVRVRGNAPRESGIALRWARSRVAALMDSLHEGADAGVVRGEVIDLGLRFHLVTAYTSLVAVDDVADALGPSRPVRIASLLPQGGTDGPLRLLTGWLLLVTGLTLLAIFLPGRGK